MNGDRPIVVLGKKRVLVEVFKLNYRKRIILINVEVYIIQPCDREDA